MQTVTLSEAALALLLLHVERSELPVDDSNRELHRELASWPDGRRPHVFGRPGAVLPVHAGRMGFRLRFKECVIGWENDSGGGGGEPG